MSFHVLNLSSMSNNVVAVVMKSSGHEVKTIVGVEKEHDLRRILANLKGSESLSTFKNISREFVDSLKGLRALHHDKLEAIVYDGIASPRLARDLATLDFIGLPGFHLVQNDGHTAKEGSIIELVTGGPPLVVVEVGGSENVPRIVVLSSSVEGGVRRENVPEQFIKVWVAERLTWENR